MENKQIKHATGFSPQALPLYENLDDAEFEQFCTELLNLHPIIPCLREGLVSNRKILEATRLLGGTGQKGTDIRAEAEKGEVWFFQCKHTKEFSRAEVIEAIQLAEKGFPQADQFVLVTTSGLSAEAQQQIHQRSKWLWWDTSRLTTEVLRLRPREDAINLVHRFFGLEWKKKLFSSSDQPLLTWQEFFANDLSQEQQSFHHRIPFVAWSDTLPRLEAFADSGAGRALIISAAGGQGKSRLLLELAQRLDKKQSPRVRFLNLNRQGLTSEQLDFLSREEGNLLLVVDDAHRLDAAIEDIARATAGVKTIRLLIATRPQALEVVRSRLYKYGYAEQLEESLRLPRWKPEEIHALAEKVLDPQHQLQAPRLARLADRCPLLVVLGSALINAGAWPETMVGEEAFRERVFRSFKEDVLNRQPEIKRERLDRLIRVLAFVSPTPKNEAFFGKAAEMLGCMPLDVADDLDLLQAVGMLVENREGIRLYPDLFADAVLLDASLDQSGNASGLYRAILSKLTASDFPALMRNLAQADWEIRSRKDAQSSLFDPIWGEFVKRFNEGEWVSYDNSVAFKKWFLEPYEDGGRKRRADRGELLTQWASFAVFLPERTLELADLALKSAEIPIQTDGKPSSNQPFTVRSSVCTALPPLLKPIAIWHHKHANRALDILWSLDAHEPHGNWNNDSNAIVAIADAASFEVNKPLKTSDMVLTWLEAKLDEPAAIDRLRGQPWILSGLLKPFFGRAVEHTWSTGRVLHMSSLRIGVEITRPLRERALALANRFLVLNDAVLCNAVIPVIKEAIHPIFGRFGSPITEEDQVSWRPDRLRVLKTIEGAIVAHKDSAVLLLEIRHVLRNRCEHDPDITFQKECCRVLEGMPNTFELRVVRVLTSWAHDEIKVRSDTTFGADLKAAEEEWTKFRRSVAKEIIDRFEGAREVCDFIRSQIKSLSITRSSVIGGALLDVLVETSPTWCAGILEEMLGAQDAMLDGFLWPVLSKAANVAPQAYKEAIEFLPITGRPEQLDALITYLGWKQLHGGGLNDDEKEAVRRSTIRTEEEITCNLASVAGLHFVNDRVLAMDVLCRIKPTGARSGSEMIEALGRLAEKHGSKLDSQEVSQCLANVGAFLFPDSASDERNLDKVAKVFPKQVYEQVRKFYQSVEADPEDRRWRGFAETLPLGPLNDSDYVEREMEALWGKALASEAGSFGKNFRIALIRSLLHSTPEALPTRMGKLIAESKNGAELELVTDLIAPRGSTFVFQFPDVVRAVLARAKELGADSGVRETLLFSAVGGGRSFSEHELDPEYRYILEQGDALANRFRDDAFLSSFYRLIATYERKNLELQKSMFRNDDEFD